MFSEDRQNAHDFAMAVVNKVLEDMPSHYVLEDIQNFKDRDSSIFAIYLAAYFVFLESMKKVERENLKSHPHHWMNKLKSLFRA